MNEARREKLREAIQYLSSAASLVDSVCDGEEDSIGNIPENLQGTEKFERMEAAVENLTDALEKLEEAKGLIQATVGK